MMRGVDYIILPVDILSLKPLRNNVEILTQKDVNCVNDLNLDTTNYIFIIP